MFFCLGDKVYVKRFPHYKGVVVGYRCGQTKIIMRYAPNKTVQWRTEELRKEENK